MNAKELRRERLQRARTRGTHTVAEWRALVAEFGGQCVRCRSRSRPLTKDHIVPLYQPDSSDAIENIQPICGRCNQSKGPERFDWKEYRRIHGFGPHTLNPWKLNLAEVAGG